MKPPYKKFIEDNIGRKSAGEIARELGIRERSVLKYIKMSGIKEKSVRERQLVKEEVEVFSSSKRWAHIVFIILVFAIAFLTYANALHNDFIWDDEFLVRDNTYIRSFTHITDIFRSYLAVSSGNINSFYRPIQDLSYMVDYFLWGRDPFGFHLTNILLHALCAVLVYIFSCKILKKTYAAFITAALFAVHTINTEAVTYVAGRADSLYLLFFLAAFIFFIKTVESFKVNSMVDMRFYSLSLIFYALAILSKEIALILPLLLVFYVFSFCSNSPNRKKFYNLCLWFCAVIVLYIMVRHTFIKFSHLAPTSIMGKFDLIQRLFTTFKVVCVYAGLLLLPLGLHMERTIKVTTSIADPAAVLAFLAVAAAFFITIRSYRYSKNVFFGLAWFFIGLIPVSNIVPINSFIAEHWLYMPAIGIYMIAGIGINKIFEKGQPGQQSVFFKTLSMVLLAALLVLYAYMTMQRNKDWKDEVSFFRNTLRYSPNNARLHLNFGNTYSEIGRNEDALKEYEEAIRIRPNFAEAYSNIGSIYFDQGNFEKAKVYISKALGIKPNFPNALHMMGMLHENEGAYKEAEASYRKALEIMPDNLPCRFRLAAMYQRNGEKEKAVYELKKILQIKPNNAEAIQLIEQYNSMQPL